MKNIKKYSVNNKFTLGVPYGNDTKKFKETFLKMLKNFHVCT